MIASTKAQMGSDKTGSQGSKATYSNYFFLVLILLYHVDGLLHISHHQVAMAVVCLPQNTNQPPIEQKLDPAQPGTYMETTLELAITAELDKDDFIQGKAHQIQRFGDGGGARIFRVGHFLIERMTEERGKQKRGKIERGFGKAVSRSRSRG